MEMESAMEITNAPLPLSATKSLVTEQLESAKTLGFSMELLVEDPQTFVIKDVWQVFAITKLLFALLTTTPSIVWHQFVNQEAEAALTNQLLEMDVLMEIHVPLTIFAPLEYVKEPQLFAHHQMTHAKSLCVEMEFALLNFFQEFLAMLTTARALLVIYALEESVYLEKELSATDRKSVV